MAGKRHECRKVGLDFFTDAEILIVSEVTLPCSPKSLFRCFEDADAWSEWVSVIEKVEWTSPRPFEVGTTRNVEMPGGMIACEEFIRRTINIMGIDNPREFRGPRKRVSDALRRIWPS